MWHLLCGIAHEATNGKVNYLRKAASLPSSKAPSRRRCLQTIKEGVKEEGKPQRSVTSQWANRNKVNLKSQISGCNFTVCNLQLGSSPKICRFDVAKLTPGRKARGLLRILLNANIMFKPLIYYRYYRSSQCKICWRYPQF